MRGEAANKASVAISAIDTNACENRLIWKGVNKPRTARNRNAHAGLPLSRLRTANRIVAAETTMQTMIRYSNGERSNTAIASVSVAASAIRRVKMHTFWCSCTVRTGEARG
jgi:hypothetical protein